MGGMYLGTDTATWEPNMRPSGSGPYDKHKDLDVERELVPASIRLQLMLPLAQCFGFGTLSPRIVLLPGQIGVTVASRTEVSWSM